MGEGKNSNAYGHEVSLRQGMASLATNLYHCVVLQQKTVNAVHGFILCGPNSKHIDKGVKCQSVTPQGYWREALNEALHFELNRQLLSNRPLATQNSAIV